MKIATKTGPGTTLHYTSSVNRAIDYILLNLAEPLSLARVAEIAGFSTFHFHRIFRSMTGESLNEFIKRVRLERSVSLLTQSVRSRKKRKTLTEIAFACGFSSSSDFSRCFRQRYDVSPSQFDVESFRERQRDTWHSAIEMPAQRYRLDPLTPGGNTDEFQVSLKELPPRSVAYLRVADSYRPNAVVDAASEMLGWAEDEGLADSQWLGYMWDDPEVVAHELCRYDIAVEVPTDFRARHDAMANQTGLASNIGSFEFPAMTVVEVPVCGPIELEMQALDWLFGTWLPASDYVPADHPSFEAWMGLPFEHGLEHFELNIQIPVSTF